MNNKFKKSRCGFVVIKLRIVSEDHFLMRWDPDWKDVNFIGGHESERDRRNLERAARRELLEEVPILRKFNSFELAPLTDEIIHGPVFSRSANKQVKYSMQFFVLKFTHNPKLLFERLGTRSRNILISESILLFKHGYRITGLVGVLNSTLQGGIKSIPYSWPDEFGEDFSYNIKVPMVIPFSIRKRIRTSY